MHLRLVIAAAFVALFAARQSGVVEFVEHQIGGCLAACPDDTDEGECPPDCEMCVCSPATRTLVPAAANLLTPIERPTPRLEVPAERPPSGVVHRVFRPPRCDVFA
ncbi:MAG: hypothetical protein RKU31_33135 [Deltaproteobacteria bacterium]|jgi:hypothetical protein